MLPESARRHYLIQKALAAGVVAKMRIQWGRVDIADLDASWRSQRVGERLFVTLSAGQTIAAGQADPYLDAVLAEQGIDVAREASVVAKSFAGVASDGRDLMTLVRDPLITVKSALKVGVPPERAMRTGESAMIRIGATQVQDAGRTAVGVGMTARPAATTWTRFLTPPSCSRCVVLAGKTYKWNQGFSRHPLCDCVHCPSSEAISGELETSPKAYFDSLSAADQDRYFTKAGAESIRQGANMNQVVNARLGMYQADGETFTTVGTSKRSVAGKRLQGERRMMPETLLARAGDDRVLAVDLLRQHGYLL